MDWYTNTLRPRPLADGGKTKEKHRKCPTNLNLFPSRAPAFLFCIFAPALATLKKWRGLNSASLKSDNCTYWVRFHKEGIFLNFHFPKSWCYTYQNMILIFPVQVSWTTPADVQALWKGFLIPIITYLLLWRNQNLVLYQTTRTLRKKSSQSHLQVFGEEFWANCIIDVSHRFKSQQPHKISFNPNFLQLRR